MAAEEGRRRSAVGDAPRGLSGGKERYRGTQLGKAMEVKKHEGAGSYRPAPSYSWIFVLRGLFVSAACMSLFCGTNEPEYLVA